MLRPRRILVLSFCLAFGLLCGDSLLAQDLAPIEITEADESSSWGPIGLIALVVTVLAVSGGTAILLMAMLVTGIVFAFATPVPVHEQIARSSVTAEKAQMRELYVHFQMYRNSHRQTWPPANGQAFLMQLWWSEVIQHDHETARLLFSAAEGADEYLAMLGYDPDQISLVEYLNDRDALTPGWINYAAFDAQGDPDLRRRLEVAPATVTIVANATIAHRDAIVYMTADGHVQELSLTELIHKGQLTQEDIDSGIVPLGKNSPIPELRSVTND